MLRWQSPLQLTEATTEEELLTTSVRDVATAQQALVMAGLVLDL
jgi:hypothetical protein